MNHKAIMQALLDHSIRNYQSMNIHDKKLKVWITSSTTISPRQKLIKVSLMIFLLMSISACSVYKSQFDCAPGKGVGCYSVSKVNDLINYGQLDDFIEGKLVTKTNSAVESAFPQFHPHQKAEKQNNRKTQIAQENQNKEKVSIFFAEYQDEKGVIHGAHEKQLFFGKAQVVQGNKVKRELK